jgi:leucyl aminopeptidase
MTSPTSPPELPIHIDDHAPAADDALAVFAFAGETTLPPGTEPRDEHLGGAMAQALARPEFAAEAGTITPVYPAQGSPRGWILGLGKRSAAETNTLRAAAAKLIQAVRAAKVERVHVVVAGLGEAFPEASVAGAVVDGAALGSFRFDRFKGAAAGEQRDPEGPVTLAFAGDAPRAAAQRQWAVAHGVATARRLAATPPNVANPADIARECQVLAETVGLTCRLIDRDAAQELNMGGLLAVGQAGSTPPVLIVLEWPGADANADPLLLVGKAITFDTGGYSLKSNGGKGMKYDKCGGMAVIGALEAAARLKTRSRVVGLIPCAENMVDARAYRPDDILTMANRVTVEITNTDAEGRLVLADALAWGTRHYQPRAVVDLATLTGGVVVALGDHCAGYFCLDAQLTGQLEAAALATGEKLWKLPLWPEHRQLMTNSPHADLQNSGERKAHPIQGAAFLSFFVGEDAPKQMPTLPWAHVDIAGVATVDADTGPFAKGPTGYGVRLLAQLMQQ